MTVIVCPKCAKQHQINIANIPTGKRVIARCKACSHRFPIVMSQLESPESLPESSSPVSSARSPGTDNTTGTSEDASPRVVTVSNLKT
ncbi:MAG: hypothetical protein HQK67_07905, partial [Desulfamplus sp.]|nr:hypothetical protein [Desulfamplus sp.]